MIEYELIKTFFFKGYRFGLEVDVPHDYTKDEPGKMCSTRGRCDFVAVKNNQVICVEIKISKADFKSPNGHNLIGHKNYYAIPIELYPAIKDLIPLGVGIYTYCSNTKTFECVNNAKTIKNPYIETTYFGTNPMARLKEDILTSTNSTIRRIYCSLIKEKEKR